MSQKGSRGARLLVVLALALLAACYVTRGEIWIVIREPTSQAR